MSSIVQSIHTLASDDKNIKEFRERLEKLAVDDLKQKNANGNTVLHCAAEGKARLNMEQIIAKLQIYNDHSALFCKNREGQTVAHMAVHHGDKSLTTCMLKDLNISQRFDVLKQVDKHGQTPLYVAAKHDNIEMVQYLLDSLKQGGDNSKAIDLICIKNAFSKTSLHEVSSQGLTDMLMTLLGEIDLGMKRKLILDQDNLGRTPLHFVILSGIPSAVSRILLEYDEGMKVKLLTAVQKGGHTPLHVAISKDNGMIIQSILQCLSEMSRENRMQVLAAKDMLGRNILHATVQEKSTVALKTVLDSLDADDQIFLLLQIDFNGDTAVHHAASMEDSNILTIMLDCLKMLEHRYKVIAFSDDQLRTSLHRAVISDSADTVEGLLKFFNHADITKFLRLKHKMGQTPLHIALEKNNKRITRILTMYLKDLESEERVQIMTEADLTGRTCLHTAAHNNSTDATAAMLGLLSKREKMDVVLRRDDDGDTAFHDAVGLGSKEVVEAILNCFEHPDERYQLIATSDSKLRTSLHLAVIKCDAEIVRCLFSFLIPSDRKRILNGKHRAGQTALHVAAEKGNVTVIKALLEFLEEMPPEDRRNLLSAADIPGRTCLHSAVSGNSAEVLKLLLETMINNGSFDFLHIRDSSGDTALDDAITHNKIALMNTILSFLTTPTEKYQFLSAADRKVRNSLQRAVISGSTEAVQLILRSVEYSDAVRLLNAKHQAGQTSLLIAISKCDKAIVEAFMNFLNDADRFDIVVEPDYDCHMPLHIAAFEKIESMHDKVDQLSRMQQMLQKGLEKFKAEEGEPNVLQSLLGEARGLGAKEKDKPKGSHADIIKIMLRSLGERGIEALKRKDLFGHTPLIIAAAGGSALAVENMLTSVNSSSVSVIELAMETNEDGQNPLHIACDYNRVDLIESILKCIPSSELGELLCTQDLQGKTPLHLALKPHKQKAAKEKRAQPAQLIKALLKNANPRQIFQALRMQDMNGKTPLLSAVKKKDSESVQFMLGKLDMTETIKLINDKTFDGKTPLGEALKSLPLVGLLFKHCAEEAYRILQCRNSEGQTFLHLAAKETDPDLVNMLLERVHSPEEKLKLFSMKDFKGQNILHVAASNKPLSSLQRFLQSLKMYENNIHNLLCLRDDCGKLPTEIAMDPQSQVHLQQVLSNASACLSCDVIDLLLRLQPVPHSSKEILKKFLENRDPQTKQTKLHMTAQWRNADVMHYIERKLDQHDWIELLNARDWLGNTVIHTAAQSGSVLDYVNNLEKTQKQELFAALNVWGENCLHLAVRSSPSHVVREMMKGIDQSEVKRLLEEKDFKEHTVLHAAAKTSMSSVSTILAASGSTAKTLLEQTDGMGCSAASVAVSDMLRKYMNTFNAFYHLFKPMKCIILFVDKDRQGAENEKERINQAFIRIGMNPEVSEDPLKVEIFQLLKGVSIDQDISGLVVVIMAHGDKGRIFDYDDQRVSIDDIILAMCTKDLKDKPKLLLVQACQGTRRPEPKEFKKLNLQPEEHDSDADPVYDAPGPGASNADGSSQYDPDVKDADVIVLYATMPGDMARRDHFIKEFSRQLDESSDDDGVETLLKRTQARMKEDDIEYQKPSFRHVMSKTLALKRIWEQ